MNWVILSQSRILRWFTIESTLDLLFNYHLLIIYLLFIYYLFISYLLFTPLYNMISSLYTQANNMRDINNHF